MNKTEKIFFEIHNNLPQEAPGSNFSSQRALGIIKNLPAAPRILDIGCGPGRHSIFLAETLKGHVTAVDIHQSFLDEVERRARASNLEESIKTINASMDSLPFSENDFDLIWSEGAAYSIGVNRALQEWFKFLKNGGFLAFTELCWTKDHNNNEAWEYWSEEYPAMSSIEENLTMCKRLGYSLIGNFVLPESDWYNYYDPVEARINKLKKVYSSDEEALDILTSQTLEIDIYRKYSSYFGYVFFILRKS